ncbi:MAG: hypothetical protein GY797_33615 [Deltaproteobacteria bacterium]|nr:hypothetical protein [Deltaproteobacteria bacterium]
MKMNKIGIIKAIVKFLEGKKTYVCLVGLAITSVLFTNGAIDEMTRDIMLALFGAGTIGAFKSGVTKALVSKKNEE